MKRTAEKLSPSQEVTLVEVIRILRAKLIWILLCGVIAAAVIGLFTACFIAPTYSAYTTMYIYTSQQPQSSGSITNSELLAAESMALTCREIMLSNCVLSQVCDAVSGEEITELTTEELMAMIHISAISDTQLLKVRVTAHDPLQAKLIADAFSSIGPAEILRITKAGGVEIVDHARLPDRPDGPSVVKNSALAFAAGCLAASIYFLVRGIYAAGEIMAFDRRVPRNPSSRASRQDRRRLRKISSNRLKNREKAHREHHHDASN